VLFPPLLLDGRGVLDVTAEDSGAKYFLAMLKYRCNPADLEAMALLQEISDGPSPPDDRWKNHNMRWLHYLVKQDLDNYAWWYWLDDDDDIPLLQDQNPHIYIWEAGCRRYGLDTKEIIHYCSAECRIRHEFDLWTRSFCPALEYAVSRINIGMLAQASMNIIYLECKLLDITKRGFDFIGMSVFNQFLIDNICLGILCFYPRFQPQLRFCPAFFLLSIFTPTVQIRMRRLPLFMTPFHVTGLKKFRKQEKTREKTNVPLILISTPHSNPLSPTSHSARA
jgi:hypothetical protein